MKMSKFQTGAVAVLGAATLSLMGVAHATERQTENSGRPTLNNPCQNDPSLCEPTTVGTRPPTTQGTVLINVCVQHPDWCAPHRPHTPLPTLLTPPTPRNPFPT